MSVFKKYKGKRITAKDKNWSKATWYVWKRIDGRIVHKSLKGAQTKEQAEAAEREIIRKAFNKRYGLGDNTGFADFIDEKYIRYVEQTNVNIKTKRIEIAHLKNRFGNQALSDIGPQDCRNAQEYFKRQSSASTANRIMSTASRIFSLACEENILDRNPMQFVKRLKEPPPRDRLLTKEEKERLWQELEKDTLMSRLCILATNLPLRRGQLLAITPDAVDLRNGVLYAEASKGRTARVIPVNSTAMHIIRSMLTEKQLPFPIKETGVRKRFKKALKAAKIENFRFHDLRKEFGSNLRKKGAHSKTIQDLFGHSSMRITDVYLPPEFEAMREAVNSLDEVQEAEGVQ